MAEPCAASEPGAVVVRCACGRTVGIIAEPGPRTKFDARCRDCKAWTYWTPERVVTVKRH